MDSVLAGGVAASWDCVVEGEGSGEGIWPALTAFWLDGRTFALGEIGTGGGGIGFAEARLEASLEGFEDPERVLMSGILLANAGGLGELMDIAMRWWLWQDRQLPRNGIVSFQGGRSNERRWW